MPIEITTEEFPVRPRPGGFFRRYDTTQLIKGVWDNNPLHDVQGRVRALLQPYKSLPLVAIHRSDEKHFPYLGQWQHRIPKEWYNAVVLVLLGLAALAITRLMIWRGL